MRNNHDRRKFLKSGIAGFGSLYGLSAFENLPNAGGPGLPEGNKLKVVCLGAHPGDPEFGCGGTLAKYSGFGHEVVLLYLTRGEAYDQQQSYERSAELRTREAETSCAILKAKPLFAGQIDGDTVLNKKSNDEVTALILAQDPDLVFTQWPVDAHPDHQVTGLLALTAWLRSGKKFHLYFYEVNTGSETMDFHPTAYVDITDVREIKKNAMFAHKTQSPESIYESFFKPMEAFRGLQAGVAAAEAFVHFSAGNTIESTIGINH